MYEPCNKRPLRERVDLGATEFNATTTRRSEVKMVGGVQPNSQKRYKPIHGYQRLESEKIPISTLRVCVCVCVCVRIFI